MTPIYLVFAGDARPAGGAGDFVASYADATEAALAMPRGPVWAHVAELSEAGLVIVAKRIGRTVAVYPERMAGKEVEGG